jgi:hypothetical protein
MKMEMTELGPMKRALKIEVPADEVNLRFVQAYSELNRQVRIPGFRPGKAPLQLLEKRYAKTIEEDVIRSLVPDYYDRAIRQAGIVPVLVEIPPLERVKVKKTRLLALPQPLKSSRPSSFEITKLRILSPSNRIRERSRMNRSTKPSTFSASKWPNYILLPPEQHWPMATMRS